MDESSYRRNFDLDKKNEIHYHSKFCIHLVIFAARNTNSLLYAKFANFTGLYFLHFTRFSNQSLQFYSFKDALSSYGVGFRSSSLDQNLVFRWNHAPIFREQQFHKSV